MNKIDEIKQAYERADEAGFWIGDVYAKSQVDEWLHYLIGEVERLRMSAVTEYAPHDIEQMEELIEIQQQENEALRKALEWYAGASWTDFEYDNGDIARQALGREANHEGN